VRDGPTNRSYGVHVADLAGVPEPVVDRSRDVPDRLREEKAIEVQGGERTNGEESTQVVFDLGSGELNAGETSTSEQQIATDGEPEGSARERLGRSVTRPGDGGRPRRTGQPRRQRDPAGRVDGEGPGVAAELDGE